MVSKVGRKRSGDRKGHKAVASTSTRRSATTAYEDQGGSESDDMDLDKELHPIGYYISDREEMLNQVFKVIKGAKLRAMLTSVLKDMDVEEVKRLCLQQLEGMSRKRIKYVLAGKELDESSATEDDEDEDDANGDQEGPDDLKDLFKDFQPAAAPNDPVTR